ncbi:ABC transporter ATP-binding protein [Actinomycetes bacterium KLBMP 9759]
MRAALVRRRGPVALAAALAASHQAGEAMVPVLIGVIIDTAVTSGSVPQLLLWIGVLAVDFAVLSYAYRFGARVAERSAELTAHDLRVRITRRVLDPHGGAATGRLSGELVNIATGDARRVGSAHMSLPFGVAAIAAIVVSAIALLRISVPLGLLVLLGTPPLLVVIHVVGRPLERRTEVEQDRAAHAAGVAADLVGGLRVLKGIGAEDAAEARYRRTSRSSLAATLRAANALAAHDGVVLAVTGLFIAVIALVGGRLAAEGAISIGGLVAAVGLALFLLGPFAAFSWVNANLAQARASAARIAEVLEAPPAVATGPGRAPDPVRGEVRLRGVTSGELRGIDLAIGAGETLGVVAPAPGTAAALLACLAREVDPTAGAVELDGVALTSFDPESARAAVLVAAHDADLFAGTLRENVAAAGGPPHVLDGAIAAAVADEVAEALPAGLDSAITERGRSLSGGQRQRVALARALAADAPVLVLHDPTTAVDTVTESRIAAAMRNVRNGRTTVLVTTSPALLAAADRVVVLDADGVRASGTHAELVHTDADYRAAVLS